jgi:hypothetical protein
MITVNLVANLATARPGNGDLVQTRGYSVVGIGGNTYRYHNISTATVDNVLVINGPGSRGRYLAEELKVIDITQAGAVSGVDSTTAIQTAINVAHTSGLPVYIPTGTFPITTTISCVAGTSKLEIIGAGRGISIIDATALGSIPALDIGNSTWTALKNFKLIGDSGNGHGIQGVDPDWQTGTYLPQHLQIEKVFVTGFSGTQTMLGGAFGGTTPANNKTIPSCGLFVAGGLEIHVYDCVFYQNGIGVYTYAANQPQVVSCIMDSNTYGGVISQNDEKSIVEKCDIINSSLTVGATATLMANTPRRNSTTIDAAGMAILGSHGCVVRGCKFKTSRVNIVTESDFNPVIEANWIRTDGKTGVLCYGPTRIERNTFYPAYIPPKTFTTNFAVNDKLTSAAHGYSNNEEVILHSAGTIPTGLFVNTPLFVINATANDFELASSPGGGALNITDNGVGAHNVAVCRREVWHDMAADTVCYIGSVSHNTFNIGGGGNTHAWIHSVTPNDLYPLDGLIEANYFGQPYELSNASIIDFGIRATGATRTFIIRDNEYHMPTNGTLQFRWFVNGEGIAPGPQFLNNQTHLVGGVITEADTYPATGVYRTESGYYGTFTPTLQFGGAAVGMTGTFGGIYCRMGGIVTFAINIELTAKGSSTGAAIIGGLPYAVVVNTWPPVALLGLNAMAGIAGATGGYITAGTTNIISTHQGATFADFLYDTNFTNASHIRLSGSYVCAVP